MTDTPPRDPETGQFVSDDVGVQEATGAVGGGDDDVLELTAAEQVDLTMRQSLAALLGENIQGGDEDFDYYEVFEWDKNPGVKQFYALALRNPYAFAVTFLPASTSWRKPPEIVDDEDASNGDQTEFESEIADLQDEVDLWNYCKRADKLAGIGEFGILVLELDDVQQDDVSEPDDDGDEVNTDAFANPVSGAEQLTGLRPFSEESIDGVTLGGPGSGRWGKPVKYQLDLSDEEDQEDATISQTGPDTMRVHHSRVIHIHSDVLLDDEVRGIPRQQPVYNNLIDIERTLGSAGQLAYRAAAWGININIDKDFDVEDDGDKLRKHLHRWEVGLENVLKTHGAQDVQSLGGEEIDPSTVIDPNIEAIASQPYMPPQSVLKGNETGERATTQDLKEWYGKIGERRREFVEPTIVRSLIDRLLEYDIVQSPKGDSYDVEWKPLHETSAKDEAEIQNTRAQMLKRWTNGNPDDYLSREQQRQFIEEGRFPSEMDEVERTFVDESSSEVQSQFEDLEESAAKLTASAPSEGDD
ncbi:anti-CBASS protein Acb1 family protein [Haloarcula sp. GH36]|uniref:anti-CBASS protein Acb1 family protein n=1 Tax=Haloarcula montana TaxID=3111776 RepID=UPI002D76AB56|nr:anti-CBASS Acb1 family protein [Haloarcula sp. GH36]